MRRYSITTLFFGAFTLSLSLAANAADTAVKEVAIDGPNSVAIKVRMEGPYTADVDLQVVCYFKYTDAGANRMSGAPVELDKRLGGAINSLRARGEFRGDRLETLVLTPKPGSIKAKALLLVGLGDEDQLSLDTLQQVGRVAQREAHLLHSTKVGFAPLIRDQGNKALDVGAVATAVMRGMLLADDTDRRLQAEKLSDKYELAEWWVEAGPAYFDDTVAGVRQAMAEATAVITQRASTKYATDAK